jgi:hypothetical protein
MNTLEKFEQMLVDNGMSENQAKQVMHLAIPEIDKLSGIYKITWDRPASEYPESIYRVLWITIKQVAIKWIDKNLPAAWFRPMFI